MLKLVSKNSSNDFEAPNEYSIFGSESDWVQIETFVRFVWPTSATVDEHLKSDKTSPIKYVEMTGVSSNSLLFRSKLTFLNKEWLLFKKNQN